jgi:hypothetical protein
MDIITFIYKSSTGRPQLFVCFRNSPERLYGKYFVHCPDCYAEGTCTQYGFQANERLDENGEKVLDYTLLIFRDIGPSASQRYFQDSRAWNLHCTPRSEAPLLKRRWDEWIEYIDRRRLKWGSSNPMGGSFGYWLNKLRTLRRHVSSGFSRDAWVEGPGITLGLKLRTYDCEIHP